ncbi:tRNA 2-thiouridine(34) synthase MnmA [Candidatus Odyssella thessalonicensis]|uniref:tRNA 2-thiouridine(34) synthase MnmA n=1 Tax=Candidatus Odyssella thessalonicensis TaxID=84647 RepID=UPI000225B93F|nr:tRNA 2-thiouridine(34) synthase MnmA [Candidatus Odyssella thessalonicensis]
MTNRFKLDGVADGSLVAVAMSGGVDSSVTAALMVEAGYQVIGITLQLYDHGQMIDKKGACCAGQDIYDARTVADKLGFPHYVLDYESVFKQSVMDDFADSYLNGETPIPCVRCNQKVKFKDLLTTAQDLGAQALITGHYVQRLPGAQRSELHRAVDPTRDQSYFLFTTTQDQLDYLRFPLGGLPKTETRQHAHRFGLKVADKPDSQDICFVPNGNYAAVVERLRPGALDAGEIVHMDGRVLGHHQGIINYTVGQRKGLGISAAEPLYVIQIEPTLKQVIIGPKEALAKHQILVREVNWLEAAERFQTPQSLIVKIRSTHPGIAATVQNLSNNEALVEFAVPEYGVSAGQACVFYEGTRVLGGGWISRSNQKG